MAGHRRGPGRIPEKPKNFKGTIGQLFRYLGRYRLGLALVLVLALASTAFGIVGPKILSTATTELATGLGRKLSGLGGIDFGKIGKILLTVLALYLVSAACSFFQSWILAGITQKLAYRLRGEISSKIHRMPMRYFERNQCTVLVYGLDMSGDYSILYHAFVCGPGQTTPIGTFRTPFKAAWHPLMGCWGQYCTQITGNYLFHSSPYNSPNKNDLSYRLYNQLGTVCSHGCVRLTVADAKWIYDNCPLGTTVSIYNASSLPVPKPSAPWLDISSPNRGWDPTDPDPANPWNK